MVIKKCLECGTEFMITESSHNNQKFCSFVCYRRNVAKRPFRIKYQKEWQRNNRLTIDGKTGKRVPCKKRIFQGFCELCNKSIIGRSHPIWHHWDDEHPEQGIWVDWNCHRICEALEHDPKFELMDKYRWFKYLMGYDNV